MSYLIRNNNVIAKTNKTYKSGLNVDYSYERAEEKINAARAYNLVNAKKAVISNAKKWEKLCNDFVDVANEINEREFYVV